MTRIEAACLAILLIAMPAAARADNQCKVNGCGPDGAIGRLVPNRFFQLCEFKPCCDSHDRCYGRCLDCGDLHGRPECKDKAKRKARRAACDNALYDDINRLNANRALCNGFAFAYWSAVNLAGDRFFYGLVMSPEAQTKFRNDFDAALKFYEFQQSHGRSSEVDDAKTAIKTLSRLDGIEKNELIFKKSGDRGQLALQSPAFRSSPRVDLPGTGTAEKQKLLNGLDVTQMEYSGERFELEKALRDIELPAVDLHKLKQQERFVPIR